MKQWIQPLFNQEKLDIVGDIHGEIKAFNNLLSHLGYDEQGNHPEGRKLVFVGDLCDRGPDSPAVLAQVKKLVDAKQAQCILGNHELNILIDSKREGSDWYFDTPGSRDKELFDSQFATKKDKEWIVPFLQSLPLALENKQLRVVHACWSATAFNRLKDLDAWEIHKHYYHFRDAANQYLKKKGILKQAQQESAPYDLNDPEYKPPFLPSIAQQDLTKQMGNPIRVITSGKEDLIKDPFYVGGKWRMLQREPWWDDYQDDIPVIIGHYWRHLHKPSSMFEGIAPLAWFGPKKNVFCIDYSVGRRYMDRNKDRPYTTNLAALRLPEKIVIVEDGTVEKTVM